MRVEINKHALDRVPISIIFDDSTVLVNLNYFFMRDRQAVDGTDYRWEDVPVVHPESFTREFAEFCLEHDVKGKFSVVPCPAAIGRVDHGLPLFSKAQQESWLAMCRELIMPNYDITPEMITHTFVVDLETLQPVDPNLWEQWGWNNLPTDEEERVTNYIALACEILHNVGLTPAGVTSPGRIWQSNRLLCQMCGKRRAQDNGQSNTVSIQARIVQRCGRLSSVVSQTRARRGNG